MPFVSPAYLAHLGSEVSTLRSQHVALGYHPVTQDTFFAPEADRFAGNYVVGVQGTGKSGLLEHLIHQDAQKGHAIVVIDPHGDLTDNCIAHMPTHRLAQTAVLDMLDEEHPFGLNLFAEAGTLTSEVRRAQAVDRVMHIFQVLWPEVMSQQGLPRYLQAAAITFLANPGATMVDMQTFLQDAAFRKSLLHQVHDQTVHDFWRFQYELLSPQEQRRIVQPLVARLEALFMGRPLMRAILGARQTTIDFRKAIENGEILFVKLPVKQLQRDASLVGTILISQLHAALFSFADVPADQRPGFSLVVDEFQHFTTPDFSEMFSEGRKFGVRVILAHQYRSQLPEYLKHATATARTKVCFRIKTDDARELAQYFPSRQTSIDPETVDKHATDELLAASYDYPPDVREFVEYYLRPLQGKKRGSRVEITDLGFNPLWVAMDMFNGSPTHSLKVADPTTHLDQLFYTVMRSSDPNQVIPFDAHRGFANCGRYSFFQQARNAGDVQPWQMEPPPELVVNGHWTRPPEGGREQFQHFLFHLRQTMRYLAKHPIGKQVQATPAEVAQMLTSLPNRSAFVRSGEDVGVIYTHDTPRRVSREELTARLTGI